MIDLELPECIINGEISVSEPLSNQDLAYHFQMGQATVSRYFNRWLYILCPSAIFNQMARMRRTVKDYANGVQ